MTNRSGLYNSLSPTRVFGSSQIGTAVGPNTSSSVTVAGSTAADGVPSNATVVVANVTAAHGTRPSYLTVYPAGVTSMPTASNVNFAVGRTVANSVTVGVGSGGNIEVYNHAGTVNVDVDVNGYYTGAGGTGSLFVPITPVRVADTRTSSPAGTEISIASNTTEKFTIATTASRIPAAAAAVAANVTVVAGNSQGYLTVYPTSDTTVPVASNVNWIANGVVPNFTIADTAGTGDVNVYNSRGATINLVIDAFGYFTGRPIMVSASVTHTSIAITYDQGVSCPSGASSSFAYYRGSKSGGTIAAQSCTTAGDVLTLTGTFTPPTNTGASIVYTARTTSLATRAVFTTGSVPTMYAATQTLSGAVIS